MSAKFDGPRAANERAPPPTHSPSLPYILHVRGHAAWTHSAERPCTPWRWVAADVHHMSWPLSLPARVRVFLKDCMHLKL